LTEISSSPLFPVVVVLIELFGCKCELGHGEKAVFGIDVERVRDCIQIHAVTILPQIFILDMA
jgi:hypothetical protein